MRRLNHKFLWPKISHSYKIHSLKFFALRHHFRRVHWQGKSELTRETVKMCLGRRYMDKILGWYATFVINLGTLKGIARNSNGWVVGIELLTMPLLEEQWVMSHVSINSPLSYVSIRIVYNILLFLSLLTLALVRLVHVFLHAPLGGSLIQELLIIWQVTLIYSLHIEVICLAL